MIQVIDVWSQCKKHDTGEEGRRRGPARVWDYNVKWSQCTVHFGTDQLMWPVLKGPEGPDQPRCLLSKQSSQSWTSQLQLWLWLYTQTHSTFHCLQWSIIWTFQNMGLVLRGLVQNPPPPPVWSKTKVMYFFTFECFPYSVIFFFFFLMTDKQECIVSTGPMVNSTVQDSNVQDSIVQYSTTQYNTVQHSTVQLPLGSVERFGEFQI